MVANILPAVIPDPGDGANRLRFNFSEYGHGAYQIKENHECSNMVANILPAYPLPQNPRDGTIGRNSTFSEHGHVAYQIKWNHEMQQQGSKYFVCSSSHTHTHTHAADWVNRSKFSLFRAWSCCISNKMES